MTGTLFYTLRHDAPAWVVYAWPGEEGEPMTAEDLAIDLDRATVGDARVLAWCDAWEVVASVDHGLRAADETKVYEASILADIIMRPVLSFVAGVRLNPYCQVDYPYDPWAAACEAADYSGDGWCEPTDDDPYGERATWLHESVVWYRRYDQCADVMVETSGDAGMTWFAVRVPDGAR